MSRSDVAGTACRTCRRRGRKCDRSLPTCRSCSQRGVTCEGYVLRWVGVAARGHLSGQTSTAEHNRAGLDVNVQQQGSRKDARPEIEGVESRLHAAADEAEFKSDTKSPDAFTPATKDTPPSVQGTSSRAITILDQYHLSPSSVTATSSLDLDGLVEYYDRELGTAFYQGEGPVETPYLCHIQPMTRSIPYVRYAVGALASCHLANRFDDDQLNRQSLHLRLKAIELLRNHLKSGSDEPDLGCLACMLLLAQLDLCSGDCIEFGTHLDAASRYVKSHGSDGTERGYFEQRLAWLDIMAATTTSRMPHWTSRDIKATLNKFRTSSGREWGFDEFYCPIDLFEYIADITVLYKLQPNMPKIDQDSTQKAILLGNAVKSWDASAFESDSRSHIVEVWRLGILLYLVRLFQLPNDVFNTTGLLDGVFHHARAIPVRTSWNVSITWPLYQAGLLLSHEDEESKSWLRDEFLTTFKSLGCFNLSRAVSILEQVWQMENDEAHDFFIYGLLKHQLIL